MLSSLFLVSSLALAQDTSHPVRYNISLGGMWIAGNLSQLQLNTSGMISYDKDHYGNDLIINGYRIYMKPGGREDFIRIGDDLSVTSVPFYYFSPNVYGFGVFNGSTSLLHKLDARLFAGGGIGYAPVRKPAFLIRAGFGVFYEHSTYPTDTFNLDVSHDGTVRAIPRIGMVSNGWFRVKKSPLSLRYLARFFLNPLAPEDFRLTVDVSTNVHIAGPLSFRFGILYAHNTVVVEDVQTFDLRSTFGIALSNRKRK